MSDLPEQHDQDKSADTKLEASAGIEKAETESAAKAEVAGEKQDVKVEVTEPVAESNPSVTEEKKAEVNATSNQEKKEAVADQNETAVEEKETEPTVDTTQHDRPEAIEEKVDEGAPANVTEEEVKQAEPEQTTKTNDPVSTNVSADPSPAISLAALRPLSPSSRTSTPPLSATTTAPAAKKFSAMNVNKKFLSKTGSPSPAGASAATKLNPLASKSTPQQFGPSLHVRSPHQFASTYRRSFISTTLNNPYNSHCQAIRIASTTIISLLEFTMGQTCITTIRLFLVKYQERYTICICSTDGLGSRHSFETSMEGCRCGRKKTRDGGSQQGLSYC